MRVKIEPLKLSGRVVAPVSKSSAHRVFICAALSKTPVKIRLCELSDDITVTIECLRQMGAVIEKNEDIYTVTPINSAKKAMLDCKESGSTLRFLLPIAATVCSSAEFVGCGRLPLRPLDILARLLSQNGVNITSDKLPLSLSGRLKSGTFLLPGDVSSQYISGLLFALPIVQGDSVIKLTTPLQSAPYVDMTIATLELFGIEIQRKGQSIFVKGGREYRAPEGIIEIERDWSNAAVWLSAGAISAPVSVLGLDIKSNQGDKAIMDVLRSFGADIEQQDSMITVRPSNLTGITLDVSHFPDIVMPIAVVAAAAAGKTELVGAARLRIKESDRLSSVTKMLTDLGADITEGVDNLIINGTNTLRGGETDSAGDHRIAMSAALASCICDKPVIINGAQAVNKSYPDFYEKMKELGGDVNVI